MNGLATYLDMGGYAGFIWPAYALTVGLLVILAVASFSASRKRAAELEKLQAASPHRQRRKTSSSELSDGL